MADTHGTAPLNVELRSLHASRGAPCRPTSDRLASDLAIHHLSVELAADEVFWMLPDSRIVYVNRSACEKLEYTRDELIGMRVWEWDPLFPREVWPTFWTRIVTEKCVQFETRHRSKSGREFPVEIKAHHIVHEGQDYLFAFVTEITERHDAQRQLRRYQEGLEDLVRERTAELERFAYRTSHDLKAPLVSSRHLAQFVAEDIQRGRLADAFGNAHRIAERLDRLRELVDDILGLVKADLKVEEREPVDLAAMVDEIRAHVLEFHAPGCCEVIAHVELDAPVPLERVRIQQVLQNLIANGVKYRDPERARSVVEVSIRRHPDALQLCVADNGLGIAPGDLPRVFDRFSRFHASVAAGSGLGLAIVHQHVERLGGTITVDSDDAGTRFVVRIPLEESP